MIKKRAVDTRELNNKANKALQSAIRKLAAERKRRGLPLTIWKDGKIVRVKVR